MEMVGEKRIASLMRGRKEGMMIMMSLGVPVFV
jgi:hypothetical protein